MVNPRQRWLAETNWLADHLDDSSVVVLDATIFMRRQDDGQWQAESGRANYDEGHIPGARFVDLLNDWQDKTAPYRYMLPAPNDFAAAAGALGIGNDSRVVIYTAAVPWWATRLWWMFRAMGHDDVAVLNGGLGKWRSEGRPLTTEPPQVSPASFEAKLRPDFVADKARVRAAIEGDAEQVLNALSQQLHTGESDLGYSRPGRIADSDNLSAMAFMDHHSGTYRPTAELANIAADVVMDKDSALICYCGGGIAATMTAFALALTGHENVAVYDGSLEEWSADPAMPMQTG